MRPRGLLETAVYVDDLRAARAFYEGVLGLEVLTEREDRHVFYRFGNGVFLVFDPGATEGEPSLVDGAPIPPHGARGPGHMAFAIGEAEVDPWRARLVERGVEIESEVDWPGGGRSLYFRDPAGNSIELATPALWGLDESAYPDVPGDSGKGGDA